MARGWESKAVESQQDDARRARAPGPGQSPREREREARRLELRLALARVRDGLTRASHPAHRRTLEDARGALEAELSGLE
jgi:hypothetical protein